MGIDTNNTENNAKTTIQIHHWECGIEDDFIEIVHSVKVTSDEVYQDFMEALRLKEADADGCRCIWVDLALSVIKEKYVYAGYVKNSCLYMELSWGMCDEEKP